jgi:plasmid stabilization system protein ParE
LLYLENEWSPQTAHNFLSLLDMRINAIKLNPYIGTITFINNTRSILVSKQNRLYYRVTKDSVIILNLIDTRRNPKKNPFNTPA